MGGGTNKTTSTTNPFPGFDKLLKKAGTDALKAYNGGYGSAINTTSQVVPWSTQTMQGMKDITQTANDNSGGKGLSGNLQNIISNGGFNDYQSGALDRMKSQLGNLGKNGLTGDQDSVLNRFQSQLQGLGRNGLTGDQDSVLNRFQNQLQGLGKNGLTNSQDDVLNRFQSQLQGLGKNGLTNSQDDVLSRFQNQLQGLGKNGLTNAQDDVLKNYTQLANSTYNSNANPGSQGVLDSILRRQADQVNLNAAASGRYGSGTHEGVLAREAGDTSNQYLTNDYNNWLGRRDSANQNAASLSQQGLGNVQGLGQNINALGQQGLGNTQNIGNSINSLGQQGLGNTQTLGQNINSLGQQGFGNTQTLGQNINSLAQQGQNNFGTAASNLFNAGQAGLGNMTNAYAGLKAPSQDLMGVGSMNENLQQRLLADQNRIFDAKNNQSWTQLQKLMGVVTGASPYTSTNTVSPGQNPFLQTLGGISTGAGLLGSLGIL